MSKITPDELRRAILQYVQPLGRGQIDSKAADFTTMINMVGFDGWDKYTDAATPFGFANNPANTFGYILNLGGAPLSPIIVGQHHLSRPLPNKGGSIIYSTEGTGKTIKTKVSLKENGDLVLESIDGSISIHVLASGKIMLGSASSSEPLVLGNAFKSLYNAHTHIGNLGVPTGTPIVPMGAAHISAKSFTEL